MNGNIIGFEQLPTVASVKDKKWKHLDQKKLCEGGTFFSEESFFRDAPFPELLLEFGSHRG